MALTVVVFGMSVDLFGLLPSTLCGANGMNDDTVFTVSWP